MAFRLIKMKEKYAMRLEEYYSEHHVDLAMMEIYNLSEFVSELAMIGFKKFVKIEEVEKEHSRTAEEEEQIKNFNELVPAAAKLHPMTWCVKNQMSRHTVHLKGEECCQCSHFLMNEGICDPL